MGSKAVQEIEERVSEPEDRVIEITQSEQQKENRLKKKIKNKQNHTGL